MIIKDIKTIRYNQVSTMSYFALPRSLHDPNLNKLIVPTFSSVDECGPVINRTLCTYLTRAKTQIDSVQNEWDKWKKYTNPYEYIHTQVPGGRGAVCKLKPLSRSFFKMLETCRTHHLIDDIVGPLKSFHFAEGPGGFIEAVANLRNDSRDEYIGMTLVDENPAVPGWKKSQAFLEKTPSVKIYVGKSGTGDMTDPENLRHCFETHRGSCQLVTGDGGFDFTSDFDHQEVMSTKLILCQIAFAIAVQKKGGNFVVKMFDTFTEASIDLLYLLSMLYDSVLFFKPNTSRVANSEKYIVCKGFKLDDSRNLVIALYHALQNFGTDSYLQKLLCLEVPYAFSIRVEEYNAIYGQQQVECIANTMCLIGSSTSDKVENMKRSHVQKCISWCQRHKVPYTKHSCNTNTFMTSRAANAFLSRSNSIDDSSEHVEAHQEMQTY